MANCRSCGIEIPEGSVYCNECEERMKADESYLDSLLSSVVANSAEIMQERPQVKTTAEPVESVFSSREKEDEIPAIGTEISGTPYDVAHVKWGDGARMPIFDELVELIMNCTYEVALYNDTYGYYICGPNRKKIFLPFSGIKTDKHKYNYLGSFWSGTCGDFRDYAHDIQWGIYDSPPLYQEVSLDIGFDDEGDFYYNVCSLFDINDNCWLAFVGLPIRPVKDKQ